MFLGLCNRRPSPDILTSKSLSDIITVCVELEHEIVDWTSPNANSSALVCNTTENKMKWFRQTENGLARDTEIAH